MNRLDRHIALIGLSGTGKSTIARILAESLGVAHCDTDAMIVAATGQSAAQLFASEGEARFRDRETAALQAVLAKPPTVIATGGGIILREENRELLRNNCLAIWLDASDGAIIDRLRASSEARPLLPGDQADALTQMRATREPLYRALAGFIISTEGRTPGEVVGALRRYLRSLE